MTHEHIVGFKVLGKQKLKYLSLFSVSINVITLIWYTLFKITKILMKLLQIIVDCIN